MTSFLYSCANQAARTAYGLVFGYQDPFKVVATPENLKKAIQEKGADVLKCEFKEIQAGKESDYSPLEYAVKVGDKDSAWALIELGASVECSRKCFGTMAHFYLHCLDENVNPDLEMLTLLLDNLDDVNALGAFGTMLESALKFMGPDKKIHWNVIELLFKRGVQISNPNGTTAFMALRDVYLCRKDGKMRSISSGKEERFLNHLIAYLELEKKYHPKSGSALSLQEFKLRTHNFQVIFSKAALSMSGSSLFVDFLSETDISEILQEIPEENRETIRNATDSFLDEQLKAEKTKCLIVCQALLKYHGFFEKLVKKEKFKDCFDPWQLETLMPLITKHSILIEHALILFKEWDLVK